MWTRFVCSVFSNTAKQYLLLECTMDYKDRIMNTQLYSMYDLYFHPVIRNWIFWLHFWSPWMLLPLITLKFVITAFFIHNYPRNSMLHSLWGRDSINKEPINESMNNKNNIKNKDTKTPAGQKKIIKGLIYILQNPLLLDFQLSIQFIWSQSISSVINLSHLKFSTVKYSNSEHLN